MASPDIGFNWQPEEEATAKICNLFAEFQNNGSNQSQVGADLAAQVSGALSWSPPGMVMV